MRNSYAGSTRGSPSQSKRPLSGFQHLKQTGTKTGDSITLYDPYFCAQRHQVKEKEDEKENKDKALEWRVKSRMKTGYVALVLAMNIGIDPPNLIKTSPCARIECWIDPTAKPANESLHLIGKALQSQYERWQPRARYKQCLDPTVDEIKKVCRSMRRSAGKERVLFHYNGRGVPFPTANNEIWVFNKNFTQYIPLSIYDLDSWMGSPAVYVFDCCKAELILKWFARNANQKNGDGVERNVILLAACGEKELLPTNPNLPADVFTACLTTPITMALKWFCSRTALTGADPELIRSIPGTVSDRRTPLGELNWIFTAITDTIAWNVLPHNLFQKLFRQDLLVASLMRNFLLAERIMRSSGCTPVSFPKLPPTYQHPLWRAWDLAADVCISRLPRLIQNPKSFKPNPFFGDQLTAFEVWLEFASEKDVEPPQQLPIVLQVLLSKQHRFKALELLAKFLDLGHWAVNYALSVGIFPYVLKLLQSPMPELREILIFIWSKILALDSSCQADLLKDSGHVYFCNALASEFVPKEQRARAAFILSAIMNNFRQGQAACLSQGLVGICLKCINDQDSEIRRWSILCLAKLWEDYNEAKWVAARENTHEKLCLLLTDPVPEVRAAAIHALGSFIGGAGDDESRQQIEKNIGLTLFVVTADMSGLARHELVISLSRLIFVNPDPFISAIIEISKEEIRLLAELEARKKNRKTLTSSRDNLRTSTKSLQTGGGPNGSGNGSVCVSIWKVILTMRNDPFPDCASTARRLVRVVYSKVSSILKEQERDPDISRLLTHLYRRGSENQQPATPTLSRKRAPLLNSLRAQRNSSTSNLMNVSQDNVLANVEDEFSIDNFPSKFYDWSFESFNCTRTQPKDESSPEEMEKDWRLRRQTKYRDHIEQVKDKRKKFESQIALMNDNETEVAALLELHPTEPLCVAADGRSTISIWNWEDSAKLQSFNNKNSSQTRISCMRLVNTQYQFMVMVGTNDGVIRLWKNVHESPQLVTGFRTLSDSHSPQHKRRSGLVFDWNQGNGQLMTSGDVPIIRVWDVERELSIQDIPTGTETTCITSLRHQPNSSKDSIVVAGCGDGAVRMFDIRCSQKNGVTAVLGGHTGWILNATIPAGNIHTVASGDTEGDVKFWDIRATNSPRNSWNVHKGEMTSFAVHDYIDVFCTGTQNQKIRIGSSKDGKELNSIRYHDGLILGQRIGPVCSLAFHPYKEILAAGATDSIISMYRAL